MFAGVTILLSMTIFLNTVQVIIPITSDSPLIGKMNIVKSSWTTINNLFFAYGNFVVDAECFMFNNFWTSWNILALAGSK